MMLAYATRRQAGKLDDEEGGALFEIALMMPLVLLLLFGILQFGIVLFGFASASFGARGAVRYASLHSSSSVSPASSSSVRAVVTPYIWMGNIRSTSVTPSWSGTGNTVGNTVTVVVSITYNVALPFSNTRQITIASTAQRIVIR